jgi:alkylglycerol monooxygenase
LIRLPFGAAAAVQTLYQFWIHTRVVDKMHPWIEYWLNTPSHHRVHHAINPKFLDKNHAGVFMIWDRLFGTFAQEDDSEIYYGITTQLKSWNPAWANIHYYIEMKDSAKRMVGLDKLKLIFAKPGWLPSYLGGQQVPQEVDKKVYRKYDSDTSNLMKLYAALQFVVLLWGTVQYLAFYSEISTFYKVVFFLLILLTMLITGAIFENKRWMIYAEYVRLPLVFIALNSFYYYWYTDWLMLMAVISLIILIGCVGFFSVTLLRAANDFKQSQFPTKSNGIV